MSSYLVEIDDEIIMNNINGILNATLEREIKSRYSDTGEVISAAVKDLVYSHKDEILEKVVDRAVKEIVRKGLPKLLERCDAE